ncbi:hypothetical protein BUALT_Bualt04G0046400 [Buddleja alternifolia]|uniref:BLOC-1-related complex subunit 5 n=1 Tax=Buddleja alternifolia TaxID=168488 RepID=A0AAV6XLB4_9LAMI|nr:hypothetical protein BUALT_Bualt04G0046400 [Buddleja alternifolia]
MGASESSLTTSQSPENGITTVSERTQGADPILQSLQSLKITKPILTSAPADSSLTDILVRKPFSSSTSGTVDPNVLLDLFSIYRDWQEEKAQKISKRQEDIENKIEVADALAVKLLQRFNYSASAMKTTSNHLSEVHSLQVELGELKGRLTEVISNCDALCKRIATEGPESLQSSFSSFAADSTDQKTISDLPSTAAASTDERTITVLPSCVSTAEEDQLPQQAS